jgi:hypothetical protein
MVVSIANLTTLKLEKVKAHQGLCMGSNGTINANDFQVCVEAYQPCYQLDNYAL